MRASTVLSLLGAAALSVAQRPANESVCDYYTTALLTNNTAANQYTLLTLVVNTAVIGNYTTPNVGVAVPGILAPGTYNGTAVNLLPYFDGMLASSNRGGSSGVAVNFLDGGGATPLMSNMPANGTTSNQYKLLTHLYEYFGYLLGCSQYGVGAFPAYSGEGSMASVHQFMDLDIYEVSYFVQQVGLSAASFGVASADVDAVGKSLMALFGYRCAPPVTVIPAQGPQYESICIAANCPIAPNATCSAYTNVTMPAAANASNTYNGTSSSSNSTSSGTSSGTNSTGSGTSGSSGSSGSSTGSASPSQYTSNGAAGLAVELSMGIVAVAAVAFSL